MIWWLGAMALGVAIGLIDYAPVNSVMTFIATAFTRMFRFIAVPTIVLAVVTTLASLGGSREMGRMFRVALTYTLLTTTAAALVGLGLYLWISPDNLPASMIKAENPYAGQAAEFSFSDHLLSMIPDNIIQPLLDGNVLSLMLVCFAVGIAISKLKDSAPVGALLKGLLGLQELLFKLIRWLIAILPLGILAFAAQLASEVGNGLMLESLGKYVLVILSANFLQMFVVIPLFLLARGLNPVKTFRAMSPAVIMAFFTKSSAATLPVNIECAEKRLKVPSKVSRFVLPICTTINMNGCAAFILVTSLYVMQNNGMDLSLGTMLVWIPIAVLSAFGNAGVPMGCYFLTLSLMSGIGADIAIMGIILPIYTIIDMVETGENVWSDASVNAMTAKSVSE